MMAIALENISKQWPGTLALDNVSIEIQEGRVHGVVGENGAGKSTLMGVLSGAFTAGKTPGTLAEAIKTSRKSASASGRPLLAMAPMFHTTPRCESRLVVKTNSRLPRRCSVAICCKTSFVMFFEIICRNHSPLSMLAPKSLVPIHRASTSSFASPPI
jgi:ABC-type phosphate/phosphonate transport system ATPase subunit